MKIILSIILCAVALSAQTRTNGQIAVSGATIDAGAAAVTRPIRSVTTLPGTCSVGHMVFKTDASAGQNLYACTATNTWSLQSGGATGLNASLVSNTLTVTCPGGKCDLYKGDTRTSLSALSFVVTPLAGTYTAYIYYEAGTVKLGAATGATFTTCTGSGTSCVTGITAFPSDVIPLFTAAVSSGAFQAGSVADVSPNFYVGKTPVAGPNITITPGATSYTIESTGGGGAVTAVNSVNFPAAPATNTVPVVTASNTITYKAIADCDASAGHGLQFDAATSNFICGTYTTIITLPAGICQAGVPIGGYNLEATATPTPVCLTGTALADMAYAFSDSQTQSIQVNVPIRAGWSGVGINFVVGWSAAATSGAVVWDAASSCVAVNASPLTATFGTPVSLTQTTSGTANGLSTSTIALDITGCSVGNRLFVRLRRDQAAGGDTLVGAANVNRVTFGVL